MSEELSGSARRVQQALKELGARGRVREMPASTRTAAEAARAVGCTVGQIAKSLVFRTDGHPPAVLVITSGKNRVDEGKLARLLGSPVRKADADFVRAVTGFAVGGVPPVGLGTALPVLIDEDLFAYAEIWAAAGTPRAVFPTTAPELARLTGGRVVRIAVEPDPG